MFYQAKDCFILLDSREILAQSMELTTQADVIPVYDISSPFNIDYVTNAGLKGSLKLSYFLTGADPLKRYMLLENNNPISGYVGGLWFNSGYLSNYTLNAGPNESANVSAEITFFDRINGEFQTNVSPTRLNRATMNLSQITVDTSASTEVFENVTNFSYAFTNDVKSNFYVNSTTDLVNVSPDRVFFGIKEARIEFVTDTLSGQLPINGRPTVGATVTFNTPNLSSSETFECSGQLLQKTISSSVSNIIKNTYSIIDNNLKPKVIITSFAPTTANFSDTIDIFGDNLDLADVLYFGDQISTRSSPTAPFEIIDETHIRAIIPHASTTGPIKLRTIFGDYIISAQTLTLNIPSATITSVSNTAQDGRKLRAFSIQVQGDELHRPSRVFVGTQQASFLRDQTDKSILYVQSPEDALNSAITVYQDDYSSSAISATKVYFPPVFTGYYPTSGAPGDTFIISGRNLTDLTKVSFIKSDAAEITGNYSVLSDIRVSVTVPAGDIQLSTVRLFNPFDLTADSQGHFYAASFISGISPQSGITGTVLSISGTNFQSALLYPSGSGVAGTTYLVAFGNEATGLFYRASNLLLTGIVPTGADNGYVTIYASDGDLRYQGSGSYFTVLKNPVIYQAYTTKKLAGNSLTAYSGQQIFGTIIGENLTTTNLIRFSGWSGVASGQTFDLNSSFFSASQNGASIVISGAYAQNINSGWYSLMVGNNVGTGIYYTGLQVNNRLERQFEASGVMSSYYSSSYYKESFARDGITSGTSGNYGVSITSNSVHPYYELRWNYDIPFNGYELWGARDSGLAYLQNLEVAVFDKDNNTVKRDLVLSAGYPVNYVYSTGFSRITGNRMRVTASGSSPTQLNLAEIIIY